MTFGELCALIEAGLSANPHIPEVRRERHDDGSAWVRNDAAVYITPAGSTGIRVEYANRGRVISAKVFAASPAMVDRIVTTAVEHLTSYVRM